MDIPHEPGGPCWVRFQRPNRPSDSPWKAGICDWSARALCRCRIDRTPETKERHLNLNQLQACAAVSAPMRAPRVFLLGEFSLQIIQSKFRGPGDLVQRPSCRRIRLSKWQLGLAVANDFECTAACRDFNRLARTTPGDVGRS